MTSVLQKTIYLRADPETVWNYLTQPEQLGEWFHKPQSPLTEGGSYEMFGRDTGDLLIHGQVRAARRPDYLEYTFTARPMGDIVSVVKWHLSAVPGGTRLSLEHEGLPQTAEGFGLILALDNGWDGHFGELRAALHAPVDA